MNKTLQKILDNEKSIRTLEEEITAIQKDFIDNNTPAFDTGDVYIINKIDFGKKFQITKVGTAYNDRDIVSKTSSALNMIFGFDIDKKSEQYNNMLLANNGLMFVYTFSECGKNGQAKKIGARTHTLTEAEIHDYIEKEMLSKVFDQ